MGNRSGKQSASPSPPSSSSSSGGFFGLLKRNKKNQQPRPFPVITPQSYLPGSAGAAGYQPGYAPGGGNQSPGMAPEQYQSSPNGFPNSYPNMNPMPATSPNDPYNDSKYGSYPRRRHKHRSGSCRPVIHIISSNSCSSISTCSTESSCSRHHHRSCSCSRDYELSPQQKQPVIFLPTQYQQQSPAIVNSASIIQSPSSIPQIVSGRRPQQYRAGPITYVRSVPQSQVSSSAAAAMNTLSQTDLKYGRRPFDWYPNDRRDCIIKEDIQVGRRGDNY